MAKDLLESSYIQKLLANQSTYNSLEVDNPNLGTISNYILTSSKTPVNISNYVLKAVELHQLDAKTPSIPLHQDGFYHCMKGNQAIKFLIPLTRMEFSKGGIRYLSISSKSNIFNHVRSDRCNFSSVIKDSQFSRSDYELINFDLNPGDILSTI